QSSCHLQSGPDAGLSARACQRSNNRTNSMSPSYSKRRSVALAALAMTAGFSAAVHAASDSLVLYNGQHKDATVALIEAFEKKTDNKVQSRDGKSNELAHQIIAEGDKSPADILYTEESSPQVMLAQQGLLTEI